MPSFTAPSHRLPALRTAAVALALCGVQPGGFIGEGLFA